ncbi:MAG: Mrp/NBP35 family ATP-binding protein [Candidatus Cloacimonetes bacterium]|nr:Mrp/NBP35 family ATP-binding protein [Candidatus Cloacimonadota bacterium]MCF7812955.1 Mrp/NBP35 family ATP-binding protein [Candidatus Cloacimonadota bacterium]
MMQAEKRLEENLKKIKHKLIVISGKGGVGKSTVSVNVAHGLAMQGKKVGILDVDIHGPSIAKMLGIEDRRLTPPEKGDRPLPIKVKENFWAMSIATLLENPDEPIIWRGPLKIGAIKQFLQDIQWPELDYLIIDSPPGTGDEPLSIVQTLKNVDGSLIVSTPQDIALLDARKTIKFSQKMNVPVMGIIENMSTFLCPHCNKEIDIFQGLGVQKAAKDFNIDILGKIPIDTNVVKSGDSGRSFMADWKDSASAKEFQKIVDKVIKKLS